MKVAHRVLRNQVIATARAMNASGINQGTSGNVSVRTAGPGSEVPEFLITPTATRYDDLTPESIVLMQGDTVVAASASAVAKPSSEWRFHHDIYRARPDVMAVVHTHSKHATALACQRRSIPAFHYMVAVAGGVDIPCSGYATYGTQALSDLVLTALAGRKACLMANHGVVATGATALAALDLAIEVENLAATYLLACQGGEPVLLSNAEMALVLEKFAGYRSN